MIVINADYFADLAAQGKRLTLPNAVITTGADGKAHQQQAPEQDPFLSGSPQTDLNELDNGAPNAFLPGLSGGPLGFAPQ